MAGIIMHIFWTQEATEDPDASEEDLDAVESYGRPAGVFNPFSTFSTSENPLLSVPHPKDHLDERIADESEEAVADVTTVVATPGTPEPTKSAVTTKLDAATNNLRAAPLVAPPAQTVTTQLFVGLSDADMKTLVGSASMNLWSSYRSATTVKPIASHNTLFNIDSARPTSYVSTTRFWTIL